MGKYLEEVQRKKLVELRNGQNGFASLLGIRVLEIGEGTSRVEMETDAQVKNPSGLSVHGGCIFSLADVAGGAAVWSMGSHAATSSMDIHFLNAAMDNRRLYAEAKEIKVGKRLAVYQIIVRDERDTLIAMATATYVRLNKELLPLSERI